MIVVDRIEGTRAVLEIGGERVDVPLAALPEGTAEGDVLLVTRQPAAAPSAPEPHAPNPKGGRILDL